MPLDLWYLHGYIPQTHDYGHVLGLRNEDGDDRVRIYSAHFHFHLNSDQVEKGLVILSVQRAH